MTTTDLLITRRRLTFKVEHLSPKGQVWLGINHTDYYDGKVVRELEFLDDYLEALKKEDITFEVS